MGSMRMLLWRLWREEEGQDLGENMRREYDKVVTALVARRRGGVRASPGAHHPGGGRLDPDRGEGGQQRFQ